MSHAKDEPDISDIYRYLTARSNSKLSFAYDESWPLLGTSAAVKCQSRMKPLAFFLFLGSLLSADPLKCTLSNVKASPDLGARVDGETLRVAWVGERGTRPGQLWLPNGLFVGDDDTIYVADAYNQRIAIFQRVRSLPGGSR